MDPKTRFNVSILAGGHSVNSVYNRVLTPLLPFIAKDFQVSIAEAGLIISAYAIGNGLFQFPISFLADYTGKRRTVVSLSLLISALPVLFYGQSLTFSALLVLVFLSGIGSSAFHPAAVAMVTEQAPEQRGYALGLFKAGGDFGSVFTPVLSGWLAVVLLSWRPATAYFVIPGILWAILIWFQFRDGKPQTGQMKQEAFSMIWELFRNHAVFLMLVLSSCRVMILRGIMTLLPFLLAEKMGYDAKGIGWVLTVYFIFGTGSSVLLGKLSDRFKYTGFIIGMMVSTTLALSLISMTLVSWALFVLLAVLAMSLGPSMGPILAVMTEVVGENRRASSVGLLYSTNEVAGAVSPFVGGLVAGLIGLQRAFLFYAVICLIAVGASFLVHRIRESQRKEPIQA